MTSSYIFFLWFALDLKRKCFGEHAVTHSLLLCKAEFLTHLQSTACLSWLSNMKDAYLIYLIVWDDTDSSYWNYPEWDLLRFSGSPEPQRPCAGKGMEPCGAWYGCTCVYSPSHLLGRREEWSTECKQW